MCENQMFCLQVFLYQMLDLCSKTAAQFSVTRWLSRDLRSIQESSSCNNYTKVKMCFPSLSIIICTESSVWETHLVFSIIKHHLVPCWVSLQRRPPWAACTDAQTDPQRPLVCAANSPHMSRLSPHPIRWFFLNRLCHEHVANSLLTQACACWEHPPLHLEALSSISVPLLWFRITACWPTWQPCCTPQSHSPAITTLIHI